MIKTVPTIFVERKKQLKEKEVDERKAQLIDSRQKMINRANNAVRDKNCVHEATANNLGRFYYISDRNSSHLYIYLYSGINNDQLADATGVAPSQRGGASMWLFEWKTLDNWEWNEILQSVLQNHMDADKENLVDLKNCAFKVARVLEDNIIQSTANYNSTI